MLQFTLCDATLAKHFATLSLTVCSCMFTMFFCVFGDFVHDFANIVHRCFLVTANMDGMNDVLSHVSLTCCRLCFLSLNLVFFAIVVMV